jgi:D-alanyl-D-alanine carboxypeptidase
VKKISLIITLLVLAVAGTSILRFKLNNPHANEGEVLGAKYTSLNLEQELKLALPPTKINDSQPPVYAKSIYLVDADSFYPLYTENADEVVPIASVTKIMTAIVALDNFELDEVVTVTERASSEIGSQIYLINGETITVESLLKGLMIQSGNDAAVALAEHLGYDEFIALMNTKADQLGLNNTLFKDPAGLNDEGHSTAKELAVLSAFAMRYPKISELARAQEATITSTDNAHTHTLETSNRLLKHDHPLFMSEATGLKTGFTPDAGHCLVSSAERDGKLLVSVVLHTHENTVEASAKESNKLLRWGFDNYSWE